MYSSFVKKFFIYSVSGVLFILFLNFIVDPFDMHSLTLYQGFNHAKQNTAERLTVALNLTQKKPKTIVLGTSRVKAFTQKDLIEITNEEEVYNAGFAGAGFDEMYYYFLHALHVQPDLKKVILGIDLFSFNEKRKPQPDFSRDRLQKKGFRFKDFKDCLFSYNSLAASCRSLYESSFSRYKSNPILEMGEKNYLAQMLGSVENYKDYRLDQAKIKQFESIVALCKEKGIELKVFICPVKAMYWEFYFQNGLWKPLEQLKRQLCSTHPIWDFSGYNSITTETLDSGAIPLYAECSHFTSYVSRLLLKRMYSQPSSIDSIGHLLTPDTVEEALTVILDDRLEWVKKN